MLVISDHLRPVEYQHHGVLSEYARDSDTVVYRGPGLGRQQSRCPTTASKWGFWEYGLARVILKQFKRGLEETT